MEGPLHPGGLAPKRRRDEAMRQNGQGRRQKRVGGRGRFELEGGQINGKWSMSGSSKDPGGAVLVAGWYTVEAVQSQVILQSLAGREIWLGVDLRRRGEGWRPQAGCRVVSVKGELQAMLTGLQG